MSKNHKFRKSGKPASQQRDNTQVTPVSSRITATRAQYQAARQHDDIVKLSINDPIRRAAEVYLAALEKRHGDTTAARSAAIQTLGSPEALRNVGPVSPLELGKGIALAKAALSVSV